MQNSLSFYIFVSITIYCNINTLFISYNMTTYREIIYLVLDEIKGISDDFSFTEDHILFMIDKYRTYLLKQKYSDVKKQMPESNYQTIKLTLVEAPSIPGDYTDFKGPYARTVEAIPFILHIGNPRVFSGTKESNVESDDTKSDVEYNGDYYSGEFTLVSRDRMRYIGYNKYLKNIIYCSIAPDNKLYFKSQKICTNGSINRDFLNLDIYFTGIFQNSVKASDLTEEGNIDIFDRTCPLEEGLIPVLVSLIIKDLTNAEYRPSDTKNNAADDLENKSGISRGGNNNEQ